MDYSKYDYHTLEYSVDKKLSHAPIDKSLSFMKRMETDIKNRQTKSERREKIVSRKRIRKTEKERVEGFNRLITDANRREMHKNVEITENNSISGKNFSNQKVTKEKWDEIYKERFQSFKNKYDDALKNKIIQKERDSKFREDKLIEEINSRTKKLNKAQISKIVERLWIESQKKKNNEVIKEESEIFKEPSKEQSRKSTRKPSSTKKIPEKKKYEGNKMNFILSNTKSTQLSSTLKKPPTNPKPIPLMNCEALSSIDDFDFFNKVKADGGTAENANPNKDKGMKIFNTKYFTFHRCKTQKETLEKGDDCQNKTTLTVRTQNTNNGFLSDNNASTLVNSILSQKLKNIKESK